MRAGRARRRHAPERSGHAAAGAAGEVRRLRGRVRGASAHLRRGPRHAPAGHAGRARDHARGGPDRVPVLVVRRGDCHERAVSDEDQEPRRNSSRSNADVHHQTHLSRRTFLQGVGATVALPLLDSMVAAQTPLGRARRRRSRASSRSTFRTARRWTSGRRRAEGTGFAFSEILKPLEPFRDRLNIVSGLAHPYVAGAGGADVSAGANHTRAAAVFLTGAVPERGAQAHLGVSADQVAAQHIGQDTPLPSLELSIEESVLNCEAAFSCAYRNSISWKSAQPSRCRCTTTRGWSSRSCSASARRTRSGARGARSRAACSTR